MRTPPVPLAAVAATALLLAGCSGGEQRTELVFFQFKPEAVDFFEAAAAEFEAANPGVDVVVDNVPDPEVALRTRLVKEDVPDVMTLNANGTYGELASAGIFADLAALPVVDDIIPGYLDVVADLGRSGPDAVDGLPYAANASGVLYNVELFEEHGQEVPQTFDELVATAEAFEADGVTPFYGMLGDAWTAQSPLAPLTAQTAPDGFFEARFAGETTFAEGWRESFDKLETLFGFTQPNVGAANYVDGTSAFARGESAMLLLGSYAVPQIRSFEPEFTIDTFALPATDDPADTTLVSGVDVVLTVGEGTDVPDEARAFVEFLLEPERVQRYSEEQVAIPTLQGLSNDDPALAGVQDLIAEDRLVGFTDHQFIPAVPLTALLQEFLVTGDADASLSRLDTAWDRVAQRRTWGIGSVTS
ncbi:ABC transporter substrate-binding protein [Aquipuribacter sp. MA13-6]|uniref:ABC transporter substrate-binding protein n=1 Tax=unclassified Aquipuribacter TaxID=2635084 RepID=UPI003EE9AC73